MGEPARPKTRNAGIPACDSRADGARHRLIANGDIVQRPMRLYVDNLAAQSAHHGIQALDLLANGGFDFRRGKGHLEAAEVGAVGITGMSADPYAAR